MSSVYINSRYNQWCALEASNNFLLELEGLELKELELEGLELIELELEELELI